MAVCPPPGGGIRSGRLHTALEARLRLTRLVPLAAPCLAAAALLAACGGGGSTNNPSDVSKIATATLPAKLPDPKILAGGVVQSGSSSGRYTIKSGDTLSAIAASFGVTLDDLLAANPGIDPTGLRAGDTIRLPETTGAAPTAAPRTPPATSPTAAATTASATEAPATEAPPTEPPRRKRRYRQTRRRRPPRRRRRVRHPHRHHSARRTPSHRATSPRRSRRSSASPSMRCSPPTLASTRRTCRSARC